ncbi:hypothetical protein [Microcoleus sp. bin38.metabat.b11b12b14.051]|nr:hypothetical protein [Microcoleus sp. bin38.metabat.b11b12b14.051]
MVVSRISGRICNSFFYFGVEMLVSDIYELVVFETEEIEVQQ